jgi:hypothetical protein
VRVRRERIEVRTAVTGDSADPIPPFPRNPAVDEVRTAGSGEPDDRIYRRTAEQPGLAPGQSH